MTGVETVTVRPEDGAGRLDRWFKRHYPGLSHGRLEKLLRTGQIRVDGKRAHAGDPIAPGQAIRVPPLPETPAAPAKSSAPRARPRDVALLPVTGRTHQLRAHCAALGTPILGDGKYGGSGAQLAGGAAARGLHLHARSLAIPHPQGGTLSVTAPLPPHMRRMWEFFGFDADVADPFAELELPA